MSSSPSFFLSFIEIIVFFFFKKHQYSPSPKTGLKRVDSVALGHLDTRGPIWNVWLEKLMLRINKQKSEYDWQRNVWPLYLIWNPNIT